MGEGDDTQLSLLYLYRGHPDGLYSKWYGKGDEFYSVSILGEGRFHVLENISDKPIRLQIEWELKQPKQ